METALNRDILSAVDLNGGGFRKIPEKQAVDNRAGFVLQQNLHRTLSDFVEGLLHCGQFKQRCKFTVVKSYHGDILRNTQFHLSKLVNDIERKNIVRTDDRRRRFRQ